MAVPRSRHEVENVSFGWQKGGECHEKKGLFYQRKYRRLHERRLLQRSLGCDSLAVAADVSVTLSQHQIVLRSGEDALLGIRHARNSP